jgi:PHD/YefM family antitoxin component YafN of YafNO toxin-antitoxin module
MNVLELTQRIQFVTNAEGHKSAVILSLDDWEKLLALLEDLEDAEEIRRAREETEDTIPWKQVKAELGIES